MSSMPATEIENPAGRWQVEQGDDFLDFLSGFFGRQKGRIDAQIIFAEELLIPGYIIHERIPPYSIRHYSGSCPCCIAPTFGVLAGEDDYLLERTTSTNSSAYALIII